MKEEKLRKIEGLQTVETVSEILGFSRQGTINLLSKLKKERHVTIWEGGNKKRIYKITLRKQRKRKPGMFDIINKYSPIMKVNLWYDHQVYGKYGPEEALVDAIQTQSFRLIIASLRLFQHINDWKRLYNLAKEKDCWQQVGALYDLSKLYFRVRKIPKNYIKTNCRKWKKLTQLKDRKNYPDIEKKWHVHIPFNRKDMGEIS